MKPISMYKETSFIHSTIKDESIYYHDYIYNLIPMIDSCNLLSTRSFRHRVLFRSYPIPSMTSDTHQLLSLTSAARRAYQQSLFITRKTVTAKPVLCFFVQPSVCETYYGEEKRLGILQISLVRAK